MATERRPNVIIFHADQQRYDSLGCAGNPHAVTPNIDALATEGTFFSRHIVSNPVCMPSRATLLSGLYPSGHTVGTNGVPLPRREHPALGMADPTVAPHVTTLADMLGEAGYRTASFGKLHLTPTRSDAGFGLPESTAAWRQGRFDESWTGPYCGFQEVLLTSGHGEQPCDPTLTHYGRWLKREHPEVSAALEAEAAQRGTRRGTVEGVPDAWLSRVPADLHHSAWLGDRACEYLNRAARDGKRFFMFVGFPDPHHPFAPPEDAARGFLDAPVPEPRLSQEELDDKPSAMRRIMENVGGRNNAGTLPPESVRQLRRYTAAMVHLIDRAVGRVIEGLRRNGQWDDTIVIFTSDHGDWLGDHGLMRKGGVPSDSLVHVPLVVRIPGGNVPGRVDRAVSNADVVPTVLQLLGLPVPEGLHGTDLFCTDERPLPMVQCLGNDLRQSSVTVYDDRYRYSVYAQLGEEELYDHPEDPAELANLAARDPAGTREIRGRLRQQLLEQHVRCTVPKPHRLSPW